MTRPPEKFYVFKLRGRWCAVSATSKENAVSWAGSVMTNSSGPTGYQSTHQEAMDTVCGILLRLRHGVSEPGFQP
jgi:hypothetical protein